MTFEAAMGDAGHMMDLPGVVGVGEGETVDGERCIVVLIVARAVTPVDEIPTQIRGIPVTIVETGPLTIEDEPRSDRGPF